MNNNFDSITIIIVTCNNWEYTKSLLKSLRKYTSYPYKIICVDNDSTDNTKKEIKKYSEVTLIENQTNLGYGKAVNVGFSKVTTPYFVLLNNDIVVSPNWLSRWIKILENNPTFWQLTTNSNCIIDKKKPVGFVSHDSWQDFKAKHKRMKPENLFKLYYRDYQSFCRLMPQRFKNRIEEVKSPMGFLGGWAILMKSEIINKIGGFLYDERFEYGFYEDVDLSWRIALAGGKIGIVRSVYLHHFINTTFDSLNLDKHLIARHNKWKFIDKWQDLIIKKYVQDSGGDLDKLKELIEKDPGKQTIVEYLGMKVVLGRV